MKLSRSAAGVLLCVLLPSSAAGQDRDATATALFDSGRKLMSQGKFAEACPQLAESERLAPSGGTLFNLAECYEHTGQTASAWAAWKDAAARANAAGKAAAEKNAVARASALEPSLAKLTIALAPGTDVAGLEVKRDGVPVGHGELGSALPVDPGAHTIEASAPKKQAWSTSVTVAPKQADARVTVTLVDAPEGAALAATPQASSPADQHAAPAAAQPGAAPASADTHAGGMGGQKVAAVVVGGVGVVGVAIGSIFGLMAKSDNDQALMNCRTSTLCTPTGLSHTDDAKSAATLSTVGFAVGAVGLVGGAVLWFTAPRSQPSTTASASIRATPVVGPSYGGLAVDAVW
jgi:hypothetical protein